MLVKHIFWVRKHFFFPKSKQLFLRIVSYRNHFLFLNIIKFFSKLGALEHTYVMISQVHVQHLNNSNLLKLLSHP